MPSPLGLIRRFGGNVIGNATSYAMGAATADTLRPELQTLVNATWALHAVRPPSVGTLALGVAQGQVPRPEAEAWAASQGFGATQFGALVDAATTGPGVPAAFDLWRRHVIDEAGFRKAVQRQGLEPEWINDLVKLFHGVLDQAQLANAIHRGLIPDPDLLLGHKPGAGKVPAYPVYPIDAIAEALANGYDRDHLGVLVGLTGLPMGSHEAAQAAFRGVIDKEDFYRAIAEGNTRNEWADAIFDQSRQIPTAHDYVEGRLRGWLHTDAEMNDGTARHGMTPEDTHLLFLVSGRPLSWHQVFIGLRRGGTYDGPIGGIDPAFLAALRQSNIRPEYYNLAWAQRFNYPSAFVLRALAAAHELTQAETEQILLYEGWEPTLAHTVSVRWASATTAAGKEQTKAELMDEYQGGYITEGELRAALTALGYAGPTLDLEVHLGDARRVKTWREKVVKAIHDAYVQHEIDEGVARADLAEAGVSGEAADNLFPLWSLEQRASVSTLTKAQVKAAYKKSAITQADAVLRLEHQGMPEGDAILYLTT